MVWNFCIQEMGCGTGKSKVTEPLIPQIKATDKPDDFSAISPRSNAVRNPPMKDGLATFDILNHFNGDSFESADLPEVFR
jgi:hypothetical protein